MIVVVVVVVVGVPAPITVIAALSLAVRPPLSITVRVAAYVPAVRTGNHVYVSGQLPMVDGKLPATGKVGAEVSAEDAKAMAQRCALNALANIDDLVGLDTVVRVVKVVGFVASAPGFTGQPGVINGASELFGAVFDQVSRELVTELETLTIQAVEHNEGWGS